MKYTDELRRRGDRQSELDNVRLEDKRGYAQALHDIADEIDARFSGRVIYDQRNAAMAEAAMWRRRYENLRRLLITATEQGDEAYDGPVVIDEDRPENYDEKPVNK